MGSLRRSSRLGGCPRLHGLIAALFSPRWGPSSAHCGALLASVGPSSSWAIFRCSSRFGGCPPRHGLIAVLSLPRWGPPRHGLVAVPLSLWWLPSCSWAHRGALLTSVGAPLHRGLIMGLLSLRWVPSNLTNCTCAVQGPCAHLTQLTAPMLCRGLAPI